MNKSFLTYFFALLIISSVVVPTCLTLIEVSCEHSITKDLEEECEASEAKEIKILAFHDVNIFFNSKKISNEVIFLAKNYTSIAINVNSPPPKFIS